MCMQAWEKDKQAAEALMKPRLAEILEVVRGANGPVLQALGAWLADVAINGTRGEAFVEDSGYDYSTRGVSTADPFDISAHETVGDFLNEELTGNTVVTYVSGSGRAAETYAEEAESLARDLLYEWLRKHCPEFFDGGEYFANDSMADVLCDAGCDAIWVMELFNAQPLAPVVERYREEAGRRQVQRDAEAQARRELADRQDAHRLKQAGTLPAQITAIAGSTYFCKQNWGVLLAELNRLTLSHGRESVGAALRLVHLNLSNSVRAEILVRYPAKPLPLH